MHLSLLARPTRRQANLSQIIGIAAFAAAFKPEPINLSTDLSTLYQELGLGKMPRLVGAHLCQGNNPLALYVPYCGRPYLVFLGPLAGRQTPGRLFF